MKVYIIAAVASNGVIGRDGKLPWHYPEDLKHFKTVTTGHAVVMGRKTWESIGKPLPNRRNIVLTRNAAYPLPAGVERYDTLDAALDASRTRKQEKAFVIGGEQVFAEALKKADGMYLTHVEQSVEGDSRFPAWDPGEWREIRRESGQGIAFVEYTRSTPNAD